MYVLTDIISVGYPMFLGATFDFWVEKQVLRLPALYHLPLYSLTTTATSNNLDSNWHQILGHPHPRTLKFLHSNSLIDVSSWNKFPPYPVVVKWGRVVNYLFKHQIKASPNF